jgi:hypothetical protein
VKDYVRNLMRCKSCGAIQPENIVTKLDKPLRRELEIGAKRYTVVLDPQGLKLKRKGHRHGVDLRWNTLINQLEGKPAIPTVAPVS